ncbi:MAG: (2Fe-2S)-binding protein [Rhodospirillales bacterium]|nr:(2Fe-2S)-binding protein [Rhodospirillales bacterium]
MMIDVKMTVNGQERTASVAPETTLLTFLRDSLVLTGSKLGCDVGDCGACTVIVNGNAVNSCLMLAVQADGKDITTIEGLSDFEHLHPLQAVFEQMSSFQCGFCAPGMIISAKHLLDKNPHPSKGEVQEALSGNLCRCTGYTKIVDAILELTSEEASAA